MVGSNIMPIAMVPRIAQITTMIARLIIARGKPLLGFSTLLTYGEIFSQPPTAKTRMDREVKYFQSKVGTKFFALKSSVTKEEAGLMARAPNIMMM